MEEWYNELFSKAKGSDFDTEEVPDKFELIVKDGNTVISEWDITQDLLDDGMSWINYTNLTLNLSLEFAFLHKDIFEEFRGDESLENILEIAVNDTLKYGHLEHGKFVYHQSEDTVLPNMYYSQSAAALFLGIVGIIIKLGEKLQARVVKVTRIYFSLWCVFAGILLFLIQYTRHIVFSKSVHAEKLKFTYILIHGASKTLLRAMILSLKIFTAFVYGFQNVMVYRPFLFREHKEALNKWLLRLSFFQSAGIFIGQTLWAAVLVFKPDHFDCILFNKRADDFKVVMIVVALFGYLISLLFSFSFTIGFYRKNTKDLGQTDIRNIKKTMIACAAEIIFDITLPIGLSFASLKCFTVALHTANKHLEGKTLVDFECDVNIRLEALDGGISNCILSFLVLQPLVQELFFLISVLIEKFRENSS